MVDWVELSAPTVESAIEAGMLELGLESRDDADVEIIREPSRGFLGFGGQDALVRVKKKEKESNRRGRRRGRGRSRGRDRRDSDSSPRQAAGREEPSPKDRSSADAATRRKKDDRRQRQPRPQQDSKQRAARPEGGAEQRQAAETQPQEEPKVTVDISEQATVVEEFLHGLVAAFGFEGQVMTRVEDDVIYAQIDGAETEALVGDRGAVMQAVLELARTVVQRKTQEGARIRLDIGGYGERRREALKIYAARLAAQVLDDGGEIMLEPMNPAERKVVHDAISEIEGVKTYSEGEEPNRSVVISLE